MSVFTQQIEWDKELIKRYDLAGPRYTSYPTAPQFQESFTETALLNAIARSNQSQRPLSLYFHIPFCDSLCYYCGCNKVVTNNKSRSLPYIQRMIQELALYADLFDHQRHVKQLHWGGGTPTFINNEEMSLLMHATRRLFQLADDDQSEFSIEIHPGRVSTNTIGHLRELGFNRISMGVQDFDTRVQKAVNRYNTVEQVSELMRSIRAHNYQSVSMDLIYGLPLQTLASIKQTLSEIIELNPDRLSLFNYAHMPHLFKSQLLISDMELPSAVEKLDILHFSIQTLEAAGYIYIGMDHFAKPEDELVRAQRAGKLQRNFQGYSTHKDCDLIAVGASSISMIDNIYVQNAKALNTYQQKLDLGLLPIARGFSLNDEDVLRRSVINSLICHLHVDFKQLEQEFAIAPRTYFAAEIAQLNPLIEDGLLSIDEYGINVHNKGRLLIRRICMVFDEYLQTAKNNIQPIRYSKII